MPTVVEEVIRQLKSGGLLRWRPAGCSDAELDSIAGMCGGRLPAAYRELMERLGKKCGDFMAGSGFLYPEVLELRTWAMELLEESGMPFRLAPTHHVFLMHQGYQFLFFDCAAGEDPPVFHYMERENEPTINAPAFSSWLLHAARDSVEARRKLKRLRK